MLQDAGGVYLTRPERKRRGRQRARATARQVLMIGALLATVAVVQLFLGGPYLTSAVLLALLALQVFVLLRKTHLLLVDVAYLETQMIWWLIALYLVNGLYSIFLAGFRVKYDSWLTYPYSPADFVWALLLVNLGVLGMIIGSQYPGAKAVAASLPAPRAWSPHRAAFWGYLFIGVALLGAALLTVKVGWLGDAFLSTAQLTSNWTRVLYWATLLGPTGMTVILLNDAGSPSSPGVLFRHTAAIVLAALATLPTGSSGRALNVALLAYTAVRLGRYRPFRLKQVGSFAVVLVVSMFLSESVWPLAQNAVRSSLMPFARSQISSAARRPLAVRGSAMAVPASFAPAARLVATTRPASTVHSTPPLVPVRHGVTGGQQEPLTGRPAPTGPLASALATALWPYDSLDNTVVLVANLRATFGFQYGATALGQVSRMARQVGLADWGYRWPSASELFTATFYPEGWQKRVAYAIPAFAEFYINFGWLGVLLGGCAFGAAAAVLRQYLEVNGHCRGAVLLYSLTAVELAPAMRGELFGTTMTHLLATLVPAFVLLRLSSLAGGRAVPADPKEVWLARMVEVSHD